MVKRYAIIKEGVVENVVLWDGSNQWPEPNETLVLLDNKHVQIGDTYDGTKFIPGTVDSSEESHPVTITPQKIADLKSQLGKATTVTTIKAALSSLIDTIDPTS